MFFEKNAKTFAMIKNYILIALRKLKKRKTQTFINVFGLMLGITISCLLFIYTIHETSYDNFHDKSKRTFRVVEISEGNENIRYVGQTAPALGPTLKRELPEVEEYVRILQFFGHVNVEINNERFHERDWFMADSNFFDVFNFKLIRGNYKSALKDPNSVILTESIAKKYFGTIDVIGKSLSFVQFSEVKVTGVLEDNPDNSHLKFDLLFSSNTAIEGLDEMLEQWDLYGAYTYLLLNNPSQKSITEKKGNQIVNDFWQDYEYRSGFYLQAIQDIYLESENVEFGIEAAKGNKFYINLFLIIAFIVLITACINYTNLATAQSLDNSHEIGVRKTSGAEKKQLIFQFLTESVITALLAFILSVALIDLLIPHFNNLTGKDFDMNYETFGYYFIFTFIVTIIVGMVSGSYPAFYLSRLKPIMHFRKESKGKNRLVLRKVLVISQFTLSAILIIIAAAAFYQLHFIQNFDKGFNEDKILVIDINSGNTRSRFQTVKKEFNNISGVEAVAASSRVPGEWKNITMIHMRPEKQLSTDSTFSYFMCFDEDMLDLYDLKLAEGEYYKGHLATDSIKILLNETAVKTLGLTNPIGSRINISGINYPFEVIGVVKDFNFQSLHERIAPLLVGYWSNPVRPIDYFSLKLNSNNYDYIISEASKVHEKFDENTSMEYHFLDQQLDQFYIEDKRAGDLFMIGSILAIFIACMGLFGMAINTTEVKKAEIGIRKAFGSSNREVIFLLLTDFIKLVFISIVLAIPISLIFLNEWLQNFAYNTGINWWLFIGVFIILLIIAILTVGGLVLKTARINPAEILRDQ